ncbi:unnamed protein product, partial [Laminaria digitata]
GQEFRRGSGGVEAARRHLRRGGGPVAVSEMCTTSNKQATNRVPTGTPMTTER